LTTYRCSKCRQYLPPEKFTKGGQHRPVSYTCSQCNIEYQRVYRRDVQRWRTVRYGVSAEQYKEMHDRQRGLCLICGGPETGQYRGKVKSLAVDHCHDTGVVRGLLCGRCNTSIGKFNHDPALLRAAIEYLETKQ
jgi:hypothetical protein